jgi:GNAT superfamily N-acetyltransferase
MAILETMNVYISFDGDTIGQKVGRARLADDVEGVRRVNQAIDNGNRIWRSWCESHGGNVVEIAGDEGALEIPADYLDELPKIREQYAKAVGATVSVGVGTKLSESSKALLAAKLRGKDRIEFYTEEVNALIEEAEKRQGSEEEKIVDEYLNKAGPAMHQGAFAGASPPSQATVSKPTVTQGEHSEAQVVADEQENSGQSPELTHAGDDFEKEFHDAARSQEQEDTEGHAQSTKNIDDVKKKIVVALQMLKQQAPVMEQIKATAPDAYNAMVGLAQAVIALSRDIQNVSSMKKAELRRNPQDMMVDSVRGALSDELRKPEYRGAANCLAGHCYVASEALYHLLGGKDAGWTPMHISHEGGPHWFLKNRHSGKILDATADQFETPVPYHLGKGKGFLTSLPSKRAGIVINRVLARKREEDGEGEPMQKMAIADIPVGPKFKRPYQESNTFDYTHVLPKEHRDMGYTLEVDQIPRRGSIGVDLIHQGKKIGYLMSDVLKGGKSGGLPGYNKTIHIHNAFIDKEHRGKGLGVPMYEALYAHAKNKLGINHASGDRHSTSAARVHKAIAEKHGLNYRPHEIDTSVRNSLPFNDKYKGYGYALKAEAKTEAAPHDAYDVANDGDLTKSGLPMPGAAAHHHVQLPVGSQLDQKVKVQHSDGKKGWVSVQSGEVMSQDPSGHPVSSRNPGGK